MQGPVKKRITGAPSIAKTAAFTRSGRMGVTTLLIGENGSGRSTLVDALLTLLVRPSIRNYNMAAGGRKQERNEKTYVKGACGSRSRDDGGRPETLFLRCGHYRSFRLLFGLLFDLLDPAQHFGHRLD